MNEIDMKVADTFEQDINNLAEHLNLVIQAHNKQLDEIEQLKADIEYWKHRYETLMKMTGVE